MQSPAVSAAEVSRLARDVGARVTRWVREAPLHPREGFIDRIEKMAATLALWGERTNLTSDASDPAEIAFHVVDSLAPVAMAIDASRHRLEAALARGARVLDLGSGAGFPGLVLAAAFDARFVLAEARRRRASYLEVASHEMGLVNVEVRRGRLTAAEVNRSFDLVTGRAFGAASALYEISAAALRPGGVLLLYASAEQAMPEPGIGLGLEGPMRWTYGVPHGDESAARAGVLWVRS